MWPASPFDLGIPCLGDGPARDKHSGGRKPEYDIDRDDDKPDEPPRPPTTGKPEQSNSKGCLAPCRAEDGTEAGRVGENVDVGDLPVVHVFPVHAKTELCGFG